MSELNIKAEQNIKSVETFEFEPIKGHPMLHWKGKRPFTSTEFYPAQLKETYGEETNGWLNKIFWGDNLQVMSHLLKKYRGQIDLIYIDPPFDSKADYKKTIELRGKTVKNDSSSFEEKQYGDIWSNDEYLQFMYERLILMRELLSENGVIFLHCDCHKNHLLRCILDEVFDDSCFRNEIIWYYPGRERASNKKLQSKHDVIFFYAKNPDVEINPMVKEWDRDERIKALRRKIYKDDDGREWFWETRGQADGIEPYKRYLDEYVEKGGALNDVWTDIQFLRGNHPERTPYPTQKPEKLLERIITSASNPGSIVFDCFMGSGTTQAVAMKLGRRFIGADINMGAIDTTVKRLLKIQKELSEQLPDDNPRYTGFEVFNVNNYDVFRNPIEAKELLINALEIQSFPDNLWDGEKDGRMYKIMPINRIATRVDLNEIITNFPRAEYDRRKDDNPGKPVELITLVCMGHEPSLAGELKMAFNKEGYKVDVEVLDILRDKANLEFKRDSDADITIENGKLVVRNFYPMNLLQKLSLQKEEVDDWKVLVDSIKIDFNYDNSVFTPTLTDIPEKNELVKGVYTIPSDASRIHIKITDVLSESFETTIELD